MTSVQLSVGKWKIRDGRTIDIVAKHPLGIGWIGVFNCGAVQVWQNDGSYWTDRRVANADIISPYVEPVVEERWMNVLHGYTYRLKKDADKTAIGCIGQIKLTLTDDKLTTVEIVE